MKTLTALMQVLNHDTSDRLEQPRLSHMSSEWTNNTPIKACHLKQVSVKKKNHSTSETTTVGVCVREANSNPH